MDNAEYRCIQCECIALFSFHVPMRDEVFVEETSSQYTDMSIKKTIQNFLIFLNL